MNPAIYFAMFLPLILYLISSTNRKKKLVASILKKRKENSKMQEIAKRFIEKECIIYSYDGNQITGVIKEICDRAALIEKNGEYEAINLDFIIRIREHPKNKNGKKKIRSS